MTDQKEDIGSGWSMPKPKFRTSAGRDVKAEPETPQSEIPTEQANRDLTDASTGTQTVRSKSNRRVRHLNKRRKSFWERNAAGLIVLGVFLVGALVYLAWLYRGKIF